MLVQANTTATWTAAAEDAADAALAADATGAANAAYAADAARAALLDAALSACSQQVPATEDSSSWHKTPSHVTAVSGHMAAFPRDHINQAASGKQASAPACQQTASSNVGAIVLPAQQKGTQCAAAQTASATTAVPLPLRTKRAVAGQGGTHGTSSPVVPQRTAAGSLAKSTSKRVPNSMTRQPAMPGVAQMGQHYKVGGSPQNVLGSRTGLTKGTVHGASPANLSATAEATKAITAKAVSAVEAASACDEIAARIDALEKTLCAKGLPDAQYMPMVAGAATKAAEQAAAACTSIVARCAEAQSAATYDKQYAMQCLAQTQLAVQAATEASEAAAATAAACRATADKIAALAQTEIIDRHAASNHVSAVLGASLGRTDTAQPAADQDRQAAAMKAAAATGTQAPPLVKSEARTTAGRPALFSKPPGQDNDLMPAAAAVNIACPSVKSTLPGVKGQILDQSKQPCMMGSTLAGGRTAAGEICSQPMDSLDAGDAGAGGTQDQHELSAMARNENAHALHGDAQEDDLADAIRASASQKIAAIEARAAAEKMAAAEKIAAIQKAAAAEAILAVQMQVAAERVAAAERLAAVEQAAAYERVAVAEKLAAAEKVANTKALMDAANQRHVAAMLPAAAFYGNAQRSMSKDSIYAAEVSAQPPALAWQPLLTELHCAAQPTIVVCSHAAGLRPYSTMFCDHPCSLSQVGLDAHLALVRSYLLG